MANLPTEEQVIKHLTGTLGVDPSHIAQRHNRIYIEMDFPYQYGEGKGTLRTSITVNDTIYVSPDYYTKIAETSYKAVNAYFNKRIKAIYQKMLEELKVREDDKASADKAVSDFIQKHKELIESSSKYLRVGFDSYRGAHIGLSWLGQECIVNPETEEISFGYGKETKTIPLDFALEFLQQVDVYQLLQEN